MSFYTLLVCQKCERGHSCIHPCFEYSDEKLKQDLEREQNNIKEAISKIDNRTAVSSGMSNEEKFDDFMENFMEYDVDQPEFLQVCNGLRMPSTIINWKFLLEYMTDRNKEYCEKEGLCEICHSPLEEKDSYEEVWGSMQVAERIVVCPHGCI